ncbi:hypothetical protein [Pirellulimonas nuda]|uniref:hypothetical protein n=1 Tax=Pirellulimonas nuda TaxID=2528009 RepID=UPI0018D2D98F|nr:hypothetical protein [Pirellulimonas nuda]
MVANYYKPGPATQPGEVSHRIANPTSRGDEDYGDWYVADNVMVGDAAVTADNWDGGVQPQGGGEVIADIKLDEPWPAMAIEQQSAEEAYRLVLENVGATLPRRDPVDRRVIEETRLGKATYAGASYDNGRAGVGQAVRTGIIDSQSDVGGWPELTSADAPRDTDHDGMPDQWESSNGLNPNDASDRNQTAADGYTMLETYLNRIE